LIADLLSQYLSAWPVFIYMPIIITLVEIKKGKDFKQALRETLKSVPLMLLVFFIMETLIFGSIVVNQNSKGLLF